MVVCEVAGSVSLQHLRAVSGIGIDQEHLDCSGCRPQNHRRMFYHEGPRRTNGHLPVSLVIDSGYANAHCIGCRALPFRCPFPQSACRRLGWARERGPEQWRMRLLQRVDHNPQGHHGDCSHDRAAPLLPTLASRLCTARSCRLAQDRTAASRGTVAHRRAGTRHSFLQSRAGQASLLMAG
jgi:hypothetical protein